MLDAFPIQQCAPHIAVNTMQAIIKTESRGNPLAISLNRGKKLLYQPRNLEQAVRWVNYLEQHHYNFDVGLAQVNIRNIHKYGYHASELLDPCKNLYLASKILQLNYIKALPRSTTRRDALYKAISAYNSGNYKQGFHNGYVNKVVMNAIKIIP
jgi:type IV secretion system protein VirB1